MKKILFASFIILSTTAFATDSLLTKLTKKGVLCNGELDVMNATRVAAQENPDDEGIQRELALTMDNYQVCMLEAKAIKGKNCAAKIENMIAANLICTMEKSQLDNVTDVDALEETQARLALLDCFTLADTACK